MARKRSTKKALLQDAKRYIIRVVSPAGTGGWNVKIRRSGRVLFRRFSDFKYGEESKALVAAQGWRDDMESQLDAMHEVWLRTWVRSRNTSGVNGVTRSVGKSKRPSGKVYECARWVACWVEVDGTRERVSFSVSKYGEAEARRLAEKARESAMQKLKLSR